MVSGVFQAENLVVASGGLSFPKIGASDLGYRIARQFGLKIVATRPSLVALVMGNKEYSSLAGVSMDVLAKVSKREFRENMVFTHRGMSGPSILQISNYWKSDEDVSFDLVPGKNALELFTRGRQSRKHLANFLGEILPQRFADIFVKKECTNKPLYQMNDAEIGFVANLLNNWPVKFNMTEGYDRAEVTLGGVSTDELSSSSMESKKVNGLYFVGEVMDVTGWLGGYNFQWAWSSGFAAGNSI